VQVPLSMEKTLFDVHGLDVEVIHGGLTPAQCVEHNLPQSLDAAKPDDPNIERWCQRFPDQTPTELDAMHPAVLQETVREALLDCYSDEQMREQQEKEKEDEKVLKRMRRTMLDHLLAVFPEHMEGLEYLRNR